LLFFGATAGRTTSTVVFTLPAPAVLRWVGWVERGQIRSRAFSSQNGVPNTSMGCALRVANQTC
jgi:hypothetical protein